MPTIIIVAGPNGAGKTSFIRTHLPSAVRESFARLDADEIERELKRSSAYEADMAFAAGRVLLERMQALTDARSNLIVETTLSLRTYANRIPEWRHAGYSIALIYLRLPSVDASIERVKRRVLKGGHNIPEMALRRRFAKSLRYLDEVYKSLVDEWYVWDSVEGDFIPAAAWDIP